MQQCKICNSALVLTLTPNLIHYGKLTCPKCNKFMGWQPKPREEAVATAPRFVAKPKGSCRVCDSGKEANLVCVECGAKICMNCALESDDGSWYCAGCFEKKFEEVA